MERISVLRKILGATHELAHAFQGCHGALVDRAPGPVQAVNRRCS